VGGIKPDHVLQGFFSALIVSRSAGGGHFGSHFGTSPFESLP